MNESRIRRGASHAASRRSFKTITDDDLSRQTPCRDPDVAALTDHLAGNPDHHDRRLRARDIPQRTPDALSAIRCSVAARPAVAAWQQRGLDGTGSCSVRVRCPRR